MIVDPCAYMSLGRPYYYNDAIKESTYVRPIPNSPPSQTSHPVYDETRRQYPNPFVGNHHGAPNAGAAGFEFPVSGQRGYNDLHQGSGQMRRGNKHQHPSQPKDRPKKKHPIPGCSPWLLVQTKLGKRFVHNPETNESLWKFPPHVLKAVVEYDRVERERRIAKEQGETDEQVVDEQGAAETEAAAAGGVGSTPSALPASVDEERAQPLLDSDGEEYEEVEVTDDEDEDHRSKRQKTEEGDLEQPVEFNEDDIAYQLAAMGEDYGLDPGEYGDGEGQDLEEGAEGLGLTEEDSKALFKDMLNDFQISPYTTWEKLIEAGHIIEDDRYTVLPNMRSRKDVWDEWSRETIQHLKEQRETEQKKDPKIPFFLFLQTHATPKLYWPEFRRKYKKEPEMSNSKLLDKDRERWYREYINRLKLPESTLKVDIVKLLTSTPLHALNRSTTPNTLPPVILTDLRYISLRKAIRDPLIEAHISTLGAAPIEPVSENEAQVKERQDRERREKALVERQAQVQEEKRRQKGALQFSRGMLEEGEQDVQRAMRVGKEGLLGHYDE